MRVRSGLIATFFLLSELAPAAGGVESALNMWRMGKTQEALSQLEGEGDAGKPDRDRAAALLLSGNIELSRGNADQARQFFEKGLALNSNLAAYGFYLLGQSYFQLKRYKDAKAALERVGYFNPPSELKHQARLIFADIALAQKDYKEAGRHLTYLERKWRRSASYPEILWKHLRAELAKKSQSSACKLARRLYAQFPAHPLVYDWSIDLQNVKVEGTRLGCMATSQDQTMRIRRLQLAGLSDQARREMELLRSSGRADDIEKADMMLVQFLTSDGYPEEALKILLRYYGTHRNEMKYQLSLARSAARSGEFQTAVGAYLKAHEIAPNQRAGREALFQAAFLSYQFQDYDGAMRRFHRFIDRYARSGLARDAKWHLAWIRYLRGDFEGAYESFENLRLSSHRRRSSSSDNRISYWSAMSLARLGRAEEAKVIFSKLESSDPTSFYAQAAKARRLNLPQAEPDAGPSLRTPATDGNGDVVNNLEGRGGDAPSASESEEALADAQKGPEANSEGVDFNDVAVDDDEDEKVVATDFRDPRLRRRFEVAQDLIGIGFSDWARHELYEVERRTRNTGYLKSLIKSYEGISSYHRAVAISDTFFSRDRVRGGYAGARDLWESGFPQAFKPYVSKSSNEFGVPEYLIWSIMRAESHFKPDVMSPVGAKGLLQVMPETGRQVSRLLGEEGEFQPGALLNPETNIRIGSRYLLRLSSKFKNAIPLVAAAYNAGPHRVESWLANFGHLEMDEFIEHIPFLETRNYVKKVVRNFAVYRGLYSNDQRPLGWLADPMPVQISGRPTPRETWEPL